MIRLPPGLSPDDVRQWLQDGVFMVRLLDRAVNKRTYSWVPCTWVGGVNGSARVEVDTVFTLDRHIVNPTSCAAFWPEFGAFNVSSGGHSWAVWSERFVERQYRRTFHSSGVAIRPPWGYMAASTLRVPQRTLTDWSAFVHAVLAPTYPQSFGEACELIDRGAPTVAVNRRLIVAGNRTADKRMLYLDGTLAATIMSGHLVPVGDTAEIAYITKIIGGYLK